MIIKMSITGFKIFQYVQYNIMVCVLVQVLHQVVSCPDAGYTLQGLATSILINNLALQKLQLPLSTTPEVVIVSISNVKTVNFH